MEATLLQYFGVDLLDRWRGGLSLRRIRNLIVCCPSDSPLVQALDHGPEWSIEAHLLDDLRMAMTSTKKKKADPHPARPGRRSSISPEVAEQRRKSTERFAEQRRRAAEQRRHQAAMP